MKPSRLLTIEVILLIFIIYLMVMPTVVSLSFSRRISDAENAIDLLNSLEYSLYWERIAAGNLAVHVDETTWEAYSCAIEERIWYQEAIEDRIQFLPNSGVSELVSLLDTLERLEGSEKEVSSSLFAQEETFTLLLEGMNRIIYIAEMERDKTEEKGQITKAAFSGLSILMLAFAIFLTWTAKKKL